MIRGFPQKSFPCGCAPSAQKIVQNAMIVLGEAAQFRRTDRFVALTQLLKAFLLKEIIPAKDFLQRLPGKIIQPHLRHLLLTPRSLRQSAMKANRYVTIPNMGTRNERPCEEGESAARRARA